MERRKRLSALILLLALTVTSCGTTALPDTAPESDTKPVTDPENKEWYSSLGDRDFGGKSFRVLSRNEVNWPQAIPEMGSGEETGEVLSDALYNRNRIVEEKFKMKFETEYYDNAESSLRSSILANDDIADIAFVSLSSGASLQKEDLLCDLTQSSAFNFDAEYWDQNAVRELSICKKLYLMCGDLTPMTGQGTWAIFFSKDLVDKNNLEDPYALVDSDNWTYEKLYQMSSAVSNDLNGDSVMDEHDQYGLLTQYGDVQMFIQAFGENYTKNDKDGIPQLAIGGSARSFDVMETISKLFSDESTLVSDRFGGKYSEYHTVSVQTPCFNEGRALFYVSGILRLFSLRDVDLDFGLLPIPKYDGDQTSYHHTVKPTWGSCVCIPKPAAFEDAAFILEALAAASHDTVKPAYFSTTLGTKLMRDERSYDMLDVILSTRSYDAMTLYNWGGLIASLNSAISENTGDLASTIESSKQSVTGEIEQMISQISGE